MNVRNSSGAGTRGPDASAAAEAGRPRAKSVLTPGRRRMLILLMAVAALMVADTLYLLANRLAEAVGSSLFAASQEALPKLYQALLLSHTGLGLLLATSAVCFALWHLGPVWSRRRRRTLATGLAVVVGIVALAVSGLFIMTAAAGRDHAWIWWAHVSVAALMPMAYLLHRVWSVRPPTRVALHGFAATTAGLALAAMVVHILLPRKIDLVRQARAAATNNAHTTAGSPAYDVNGRHRQAEAFLAVGDVPVQSPFYPAGTTTTSGGLLPERILLREFAGDRGLAANDFKKYGFVVSDRIGAEGCARCHADTVAQWAASAHRFASFNNPFYEAAINLLRKTATLENRPVLEHLAHLGLPASKLPLVRSKWCAGCHDLAILMPGRMTDEIDRTSVAAQAGLTCTVCHAIDAIHNNTGNNHYNLADGRDDPYVFADSRGRLGTFLHDTAIKARPAAHKRGLLKPFFRTSEYCAVCHKVNIDVPINNYRWLRGQDEYDNWHDSGVAHNASRTFYLPSKKRLCRDCHMPLERVVLGDVSARNGTIRSHRFLAANTALPFVRGDTDTLRRIEAFLRDDKLRVDLFALKVESGNGRRTIYALDRAKPTLLPGRTVQIEVVVRNRNVGHTFPGGTNDSNQGWLEVSLFDDRGTPLGISGAVRDDGTVDPAAHFYRALLIDRDGERIHRRDAHNIYAPLYVRVIGPGTADVAHFELTLPDELSGRFLTIRARLLWRKFDRPFTEFAYHNNRDAFAMFDRVPDLPITEIDRSELTLPVGGTTSTAGASTKQNTGLTDWTRLNDYGIALLLQGNTRAAAAAFRRLARIAPDRVDGWRNLARVARAEGDLTTAYDALRNAEDIAPGDPQTAWVWGQVLAEDGRYDEAAAAYRRVLQAFPEDRGSWRELAVVYYRDHKFDDALAAGRRVLAIDPEDRIAHYYRMLALRALGREAEAERAKRAYEKYQIDESAQQVTRAYRLAHPEDNLESQAVHVHHIAIQQPRDALARTRSPR